MDDLKKLLTEALGMILEGAKSGSAFAKEQIPIIIQEKLHFDLAISLMFLLAWLIIGGIVIWMGFVVHRGDRTDLSDDQIIGGNFLKLGGLAAIIASSCYNSYYIIEITFAPRLYILEWVKEMLK